MSISFSWSLLHENVQTYGSIFLNKKLKAIDMQEKKKNFRTALTSLLHNFHSHKLAILWTMLNTLKHLSMKEGCLFVFCFVLMGSTEPGCFKSPSWSLWKALKEEGCMGLVPWRLDMRWKSSRTWMISSLKIKSNCTWNFQRNWDVPLVLLKRSWWAGFNGIYLVRFGFRLWEIVILKWFLLLKIQINSRNPGFGRKNQLRMW